MQTDRGSCEPRPARRTVRRPVTAKVLVLSPHTDDGELGCGGTVTRLVDEHAIVHWLAFSTGTATADECREAVGCLGIHNPAILDFPTRRFPEHRQQILDLLYRIAQGGAYDYVFCPASTHRHQDHQVIHAEARRAFVRSTVLGYEQPWSQVCSAYNNFWPLREADVVRKLQALSAYESQKDRAYMNPLIIWGLATLRAVGLECEFAECFEVVRWVTRPPAPLSIEEVIDA